MGEGGPGALGTGHQFGRYTITEFFAAGGMAEVYRAEDVTTGEAVALKVLAGDLADDRQFRDRFLRETRVVTRLAHPHILPVLGSGEDNGVLYIAMPFVDPTPYRRPDLSAVVAADGPLGLDVTLSITGQVADALDVAHEQGLIHRDVTPGNILLRRDSADLAQAHAYLTDFGITRRATSRSTRTGGFVGTLHYAAPEQIRNEPLDRRTDVYALACVVYEMLTGETPYGGFDDVGALIFAILDSAPPSVGLHRPELPDAVDAVLRTAMAKDRRLRPATPRALSDALAAARDGTWAPAPVVAEQPSDPGTAEPVEEPATSVPAGPRRHRRVLYVAAALSLVLTSGGVALARSSADAPGPTDTVTEQRRGETSATRDRDDDVAGEDVPPDDVQPPLPTEPSVEPPVEAPSVPGPTAELPGGESPADAGGDASTPGGDLGAGTTRRPPAGDAPIAPVVPAPPGAPPASVAPPVERQPEVQPPAPAEPAAPVRPSGAITSPGPDAQIESRIVLQGTAHVPEGHQLWTFIRPADGTYYTTSDGPIPVTPSGAWSTKVRVGTGPEDVGRSAELIAVIAPVGGAIQGGVDAKGERFSARFGDIPADSVEVARVRVVLAAWVQG